MLLVRSAPKSQSIPASGVAGGHRTKSPTVELSGSGAISREQRAARRDGGTASSEAVEDYVRAILRTARGSRRVASTTGIAEYLAVTPASVSSMFKKLARLELVVYEPYRGVRLTADGERLALRLTRRHRLLETMLSEVLGMPLERVHAEADRLEHHISAELEELIAARLGERSLDPHGDPIPTADLTVPRDDTMPLADARAGQSGKVARVPDGDAEVLRYLSETARLRPGTLFVVHEKQPFGGPMVLALGGRRVVLDRPVAALVRVRLTTAVHDGRDDRA